MQEEALHLLVINKIHPPPYLDCFYISLFLKTYADMKLCAVEIAYFCKKNNHGNTHN